MGKDGDLLSRFGSNLAESLGAGRGARAGSAAPAAAPAGATRHDGCTRLRAAAEIEVGRIVPDPDQPRTEFDPESIGRLAASLAAHGQLQPVVVRWAEEIGRYVLVAGERRWRAALQAGRPSVACVILDGPRSASEILELQLVENALREDLRPVEQARAYRTLLDRNGWTAARLAEALHLDPATVARSLALLDLPGPVQEAVERGALPPSTAYEVSKLADPEARRAVADRVVAEGLSRAETIEAVRRAAPAGPKGRGAGKPRKVATRTLRSSNGYRATVDCRRGIDPAGLLAALEEWAAQARAALAAAPGEAA